jgi:hypothetical protein
MKKLLSEGAAGGHMDHPFDVPWVKTGSDLLSFFTNNVEEYLQKHEGSVKFDGTNVSFKLVKEPQGDGTERYEFAVDRGSKKQRDLDGIVVSRIDMAFPEGHGMRTSIAALLEIFNAVLRSGTINEELKALGFYDDSNVFFNTEYVNESEDEEGNRLATNVIVYNEDFFAIHGLKEFFMQPSPTGRSISRGSREVSLNAKQEEALASLISKARRFSKNFNIYGPNDARASRKSTDVVNFDEVLSEKVTIYPTPDNPVTNTLGAWLRSEKTKNPGMEEITTPFRKSGKIGAMTKFVYTSLIPDSGDAMSVNELLGSPEPDLPDQDWSKYEEMAQNAMNGAIFWHATRLLGKKVLENLTTSVGPADMTKHEGLVMRDKAIFKWHKPIKLTGDFILGGLGGTISKLLDTDKQPAKRDIYEEEHEEESGLQAHGPLKDPPVVVLFPGKFKPPHRGHLDVVEHYANVAKQMGGPASKVVIWVSRIPKEENGHTFSAEDSIAIWNLYLDAKNLNDVVNIEVEIPGKASPVGAAYDYVEHEAEPGTIVLLASSTKGGDESRFANAAQARAKEGVIVPDPTPYAPSPKGAVLHASDFRRAIVNKGDIDEWLPHEVDANGNKISLVAPEKIFGVLGIKLPQSDRVPYQATAGTSYNSVQEEKLAMPIFFRMIEEALEEQTEPFQRKVKAKHSRMKNKLVTKGGNKDTGGGEGHQKPSTKRSKSSPPIGENEELEEISAVSGVGGSIEVGGGKRKKKNKRETLMREDDLVEQVMAYLIKDNFQEI